MLIKHYPWTTHLWTQSSFKESEIWSRYLSGKFRQIFVELNLNLYDNQWYDFSSATDGRKKYIHQNFSELSKYEYSKKCLSWFTECWTLKDFNVLKYISTAGNWFCPKIFFIQSCPKILFFDKIFFP